MIEAIILFCLVIGLLALRVNLVGVLLILAVYIHFVWGDGILSYIVEDMWVAIDKEVLLSIPLFLLCGSVMSKGAIANRMINIATTMTAPLPGGLGIATIITCGIFAAISGSSAVTLIAVGSLAYPALLKEGYGKPFSLGLLTSGGTLGVIIPPSIPMILYGIVTETSIVDLFIAGVIPGILLTLLLSAYALWRARKMERKRFDATAFLSALRSGIWSILMPVLLLGGIYSGFFSPTESAAIALAYSLIIEIFVHREVNLADLYDTVIETATLMGSLFPVLAITLSVNLLLTSHQVPAELTNWMSGLITDKFTFLLIMNAVLLVVGCIMDMTSAILILAPILMYLGRNYGVDPIHLGIIMTVNLEIGLLTPPLGMNLIIAMTAFRENFNLIAKSALPFVLVMLIGLALITYIPQLSLVLLR